MKKNMCIWSINHTSIKKIKNEIKIDQLLGKKAMTNLDSILKSRDITLPTNICLVKAMTNLDSILKSRDITLPTKVHLAKAMVFPVVIYGCDSWTIKKAESQRIVALELWCWRRLLRVPWTIRRSNQSILKEINREYSLERLMLKLNFQYFGQLT